MPSEQGPIASPEMSAEYHRRRRLWVRFAIVSVVGGFIAFGLFNPPLPIIFIAFLIGVSATAIMSVRVYCCPNCQRPFTRGHQADKCEHCGMAFRSGE